MVQAFGFQAAGLVQGKICKPLLGALFDRGASGAPHAATTGNSMLLNGKWSKHRKAGIFWHPGLVFCKLLWFSVLPALLQMGIWLSSGKLMLCREFNACFTKRTASSPVLFGPIWIFDSRFPPLWASYGQIVYCPNIGTCGIFGSRGHW